MFNFIAWNAKPKIDVGNDTTLSINDTIRFSYFTVDSFNVKGVIENPLSNNNIIKWELSINGTPYTETNVNDTSILT